MNYSFDTTAVKTSGTDGLSDKYFLGIPIGTFQLIWKLTLQTTWGYSHLINVEVIFLVPGNLILFSIFLSTGQYSTCSALDPNSWVNILICLMCYHIIWKHDLFLFIPSTSRVHQYRKTTTSCTYFHQVAADLLQEVFPGILLLPYTLIWSHQGGRQV